MRGGAPGGRLVQPRGHHLPRAQDRDQRWEVILYSSLYTCIALYWFRLPRDCGDGQPHVLLCWPLHHLVDNISDDGDDDDDYYYYDDDNSDVHKDGADLFSHECQPSAD